MGSNRYQSDFSIVIHDINSPVLSLTRGKFSYNNSTTKIDGNNTVQNNTTKQDMNVQMPSGSGALLGLGFPIYLKNNSNSNFNSKSICNVPYFAAP